MSLLRRFLTPRRLRYAWLVGGVLWLAWLVSVVAGPGRLDLAGTPVGTDYLQFYAAGTTVRTGNSDRLYDIAYQTALERDIIGAGLTTYHAFITPPFLAWLFVPLSMLPYALSFAVWSLLGMLFLWLSLWLLRLSHGGKAFLWSLTFFPVFAAVSFGQNALLSLLIFAGTYRLWLGGRTLWAGLLLSLVLYKPQLVVGVAFLWVLELRSSWSALLGMTIGGAALVALSFGLTPEAGWGYLEFARTTLPDLPSWQVFPLWHLHTVRGFWRILLPWLPAAGDIVTFVLSLGGVWAFVRFWQRQRTRPSLLYSASVLLGLFLTPHAMIYDWSLLLIPALLFVELHPDLRERWRSEYALVWAAALVSGPLTFGQLQVLPLAVQVSVPVLTWAAYRCGRDVVMAG